MPSCGDRAPASGPFVMSSRASVGGGALLGSHVSAFPDKMRSQLPRKGARGQGAHGRIGDRRATRHRPRHPVEDIMVLCDNISTVECGIYINVNECSGCWVRDWLVEHRD